MSNSGRILALRLLPVRCYRKFWSRRATKCVASLAFLFCIAVVIPRSDPRLYQQMRKSVPRDQINPSSTVESTRSVEALVVEVDKPDIPARRLMALHNCSEHDLLGEMHINPNITPSFKEVENISNHHLLRGGCYNPTCIPTQKIAVIVPFKDRDAHLKTLLYYLHPMMQRQGIAYCIYVSEQFDDGQFNKALIMNAAFEEAMKIDFYDCIIFHDVDMIPEDDRNIYSCGDQPKHMSPAIDKFNYKPHYGTDFGGVTGITPEQYRKANGHSNQFWGWGGEDNDMEFRIFNSGMKIIAVPLNIGRYKMIVHKHPWKFSPNKFPTRLNKTRVQRAKTDGLSDLKYRLVTTESHPTYSKFVIDIRKLDIQRITLHLDDSPAMDVDIKNGPCRYDRTEGKYLDFSIELTHVKEASHLIDKFLKKKKKAPPVPPHINIPTTPSSQFRFSVVDNYDDAIDLCEKLRPECKGIQRENSEEKYTLRRSNVPRHVVISGALEPKVPEKEIPFNFTLPRRKLFFPKKVAFTRYCPGGSGDFQILKKPLQINLTNVSVPQHWFKFTVQFSVLLQPSTSLFYRENTNFEGQLSKNENMFRFTWPGNKLPNFEDPQTPREYTFQTAQFPIPNVPGCYAMESRIVDNRTQPLYHWNWWFEVTSGDKELDARIREEHFKEQSKKNMLNAKRAALASHQQRKDAMAIKRQREQNKKIAKKHIEALNNLQPSDIFKANKDSMVINSLGQRVVYTGQSQIQQRDSSQNMPPVIQAVPTSNPEEIKLAVQRKYHKSLPENINQIINLNSGRT